MSPARVSISARSARLVLGAYPGDWVGNDSATGRAFEELRSALKPRRKSPVPTRRAATKAKKATKKEKRSAVREAVMMRALGHCECGCGLRVGETDLELDHFWGRARSESAESCWALARYHHLMKTRNVPSAAHWLELFIKHCALQGYPDEAAKARARLESLGLMEMIQVVP